MLRAQQAGLLGAPPGEADLVGVVTFSSASLSATSSSAALPLPLSLMPAPSWTLSRWAPAMTTLESSPDADSAKTL